MADYPYIAIEGPIGVGKTTLARLMQPAFAAQLVLEAFEENPFLGNFYADRARYAFQTQVFFLLSRYHQQHRVLATLLKAGPVISDYTFAKDWLFAHLNLQGDELATYDRLYGVLDEKLPTPDVLVYLHADTPVLLERIALRDRSYERNIAPAYLESLADAYEELLVTHHELNVLRINTNRVNIVHDPEHLAGVIQRVRSALGAGTHQPALPQFMERA